MRALLIVGIFVVILGILSLFVPIRYRERHAVKAGPISVGVTTEESRKTPPAVTGTLIATGVVLMIVGARKR